MLSCTGMGHELRKPTTMLSIGDNGCFEEHAS
jgi:hypothetical protein